LNTLVAGDLVLEPQVVAHAAEMFLVLGDPAIYEFENAPPESLVWLEQRFVKLESRRSADGTEQWLNWVIRLPSGELAGYVQATIASEFVAYIAYELASKFWRRRVGSTAVGAVLAELAKTYHMRTFAAILKARNVRSAALLRHLGFGSQRPAGLTPIEHQSDEMVMYKASGERVEDAC
jgi:[ribosomal protein S5]-alanine N-acetyltransferase